MRFLFCFELFEQCQRPVTEERQVRRQGITVCRPSREIDGLFGISQALVGDRRPMGCQALLPLQCISRLAMPPSPEDSMMSPMYSRTPQRIVSFVQALNSPSRNQGLPQQLSQMPRSLR